MVPLVKNRGLAKRSNTPQPQPLSSEYGTYKTVWSWFQVNILKIYHVVPSSLGGGLILEHGGGGWSVQTEGGKEGERDRERERERDRKRERESWSVPANSKVCPPHLAEFQTHLLVVDMCFQHSSW